LRTQSAPGGGPWLQASAGEEGAKVRLFVFPHAGGAPGAFHTWVDVLAPQVEPHFVALPGREKRFHETPITRCDEIVAPVAAAIASFDQRPFVLFGHSMGSMLAFEVARQLRRSGRPGPAALVVSGRCAPQLKPRTPVLRDLPDSELIRHVARLFGGIAAELLQESELIDLMVGVLRADLTVIENYRYVPEEPLGCSILALGGTGDPWVTEDELEAWRQQTSAGFASARFAGDHFYFKTPSGQGQLLALLLEYCAGVVARVAMSG
jgi:medium-chain acyl-[acyl-carrier-protein] hydrolase